jgi:hypothetical protein
LELLSDAESIEMGDWVCFFIVPPYILWVYNTLGKWGVLGDFFGNFALFARFLGKMGQFFGDFWRRI